MSSGMMPMAPGWTARPMTVGRLLDRLWTILRGHARTFATLSMLPTLAMLVLYGVMFGAFVAAGMIHFPPTQQPPDPQRVLWTVFPAMLIVMVPMMVVFGVYQAATCDAAIAVNRGLEPVCGEVYRSAWKKAGRYTWLVLVCWLIVMAPMLVGIALFALGGVLTGGSGSDGNAGALFVLVPFLFLVYVGGFVYTVWMMLRLGLAFPACVAEDVTAWDAVQRSQRLTVKAKGRMFVVLLVVWAISYAAMMVFELVGMAVMGILLLIGSALHMHIEQPASIAVLVVVGIILAVAICLLSMLIWSAYAISLSVIYEDQVMRIDGPRASPAVAGGQPV